MKLSEIEKKLEVVELKRQGLKAAQAEALGRKYVTCTSTIAFQGKGCGKKSQIGTLTYIQTHFHVPAYGCTGGDYWKEGEGQFECPKCGYLNRLYDRKEIQELKRYFKDVEDIHE
jgi:hypothetical protein